MNIVETRKRTTIKTITWRVVAVFNSWAILSMSVGDTNLQNAIFMNVTGFFAFYFFERVWSKISYGRHFSE
jgi:uncharacterized membrane protein